MKSISLHPLIFMQHSFLMSKSHYANDTNLTIIDTIQLETLNIAELTRPQTLSRLVLQREKNLVSSLAPWVLLSTLRIECCTPMTRRFKMVENV
jgi:hypothetical protein